MVPKGWEEVQFSSIVKETQLGTTERHKGEVCEEAIPLLKMGNLTWGSFNLTNLELIPRAKVDKNLILKKGDFLFNTRNTPELVGKSAVWDGRIKEITFDNNINRITFTEKVDSFYLRYYLNFGKGKSKINSLPAGSTSVAAIYWKDLKNIKVIIPPLPEQQKIAKILSTWDKAISTTERLIDNSTQQKKALMQQLLTGKKRLLNDEGKRFVGEWNKKTLADICSKTISYGIVQTGEHVKDGVPCVRVVDLTQKTVSKNDMITTSDEINQSYNKTILESGEVMMALRGVVGLVRLVNEDLVGSNITRGLARLAPKNELIKSDFFLWILRSSYVKNELMRKVGGSALQEISLTALRKVQIPFPSLQEQQKIANVLTNADKEIELLEQQLADLQQEKKALMQVLLTGKKRVVVDGEVA
ncbi:restriction endonuclease subunit S [Psychrobacter pacificensis]|uniref:restriction endonuclease subunit S n=1 Tax=Psychrobacter pacificensis TaxID=112002 RepID=UPI003CFD5F24